MRNLRSNTIVTNRGGKRREGEVEGDGVLKLTNAGCLLGVIFVTNKQKYRQFSTTNFPR